MGDKLKKHEQSGDLILDLQKQQTLAEAEAKAVMTKKIGWIEKRAKGQAGSVEPGFEKVYQVKADELTKELITLRLQLDSKYIKEMQHVILNSLQRRAYLSIELAQTKAGPLDVHAQISQGINFLQSASIPSLVYQQLQSIDKPLAASYLEGMKNRAISNVPDLLPTLEHLKMPNPELTPEDWKVIVDQVKVLNEKDPDWLKSATATMLMGLIPQKQRPTFVEKMLEEPGYQGVLQTLLLSGYLQLAQVTQVLNSKIKTLNPVKDAVQLNGLQEFSNSLQGESGKELAKAQKQLEVAIVHERKKYPHGRHSGQSSSARELLTFSGIGGTLLALNGMVTVGANVLMNLHQPSELLTNKSLAIGLAMTVTGLEVSNGVGGIYNKPSTILAKTVEKADEATGGRKTHRDEMQELALQSFEHDILWHEKASNVYFQFAGEINAAYTKKVAETHSSKVKLTMEDSGLNWEKIQKDFAPIDKIEVENTISQWVSRMAKKGSSWKSVESQKQQIGGSGTPESWRGKYGVADIEPLKEEVRQSYLVSKETNKPQ